MRQVFEAFLFAYAYDQGLSQREIARALRCSQSKVNDYLRRFRSAGLLWPVHQTWTGGGRRATVRNRHARGRRPRVARHDDDPRNGRGGPAAVEREDVHPEMRPCMFSYYVR